MSGHCLSLYIVSAGVCECVCEWVCVWYIFRLMSITVFGLSCNLSLLFIRAQLGVRMSTPCCVCRCNCECVGVGVGVGVKLEVCVCVGLCVTLLAWQHAKKRM